MREDLKTYEARLSFKTTEAGAQMAQDILTDACHQIDAGVGDFIWVDQPVGPTGKISTERQEAEASVEEVDVELTEDEIPVE